MPINAAVVYSNQKLEPAYDPDLARQRAVSIKPSQTIERGTILGELTGVNAVQTVTLGAGNTGGAFTLSFGGQTTAALAYDASAAQVLAALAALATIGAGNAMVSGNAGGPYAITFIGALGNAPVGAIAGSGELTGGANTVTVAQTVAGVSQAGGIYAAYAEGNTDGTQVPKGVCIYDMVTDAYGNVSLSATGGQTYPPVAGAVELTAPMYVSGAFRSMELIGLDANAVGVLGAHFEQGTLLDGGIVRIP